MNSKHLRFWAVLSAAGLAAVAGAASVRAAAPARAAKPKGAAITATDGAGLKQLLAAHKGKVVVLNLWATWCPPCVAEFPDLVKLHNAYAAKGLTVVAVSLDEPEDRAKVDAFIKEQKAAFPVVVRKGAEAEELVNAVDKNWSGAIPVTYIFDRSGKRYGAGMVGQHSYQKFEAAVKPVLGGK